MLLLSSAGTCCRADKLFIVNKMKHMKETGRK